MSTLLFEARELIEESRRTSEASTLRVLELLEAILDQLPTPATTQPTGDERSRANVGQAAADAMLALQSADIIGQQLAHAAALIERSVASLGNPDEIVEMPAVGTADPNASTQGREERQSVADDIFG